MSTEIVYEKGTVVNITDVTDAYPVIGKYYLLSKYFKRNNELMTAWYSSSLEGESNEDFTIISRLGSSLVINEQSSKVSFEEMFIKEINETSNV